VKAGDELAGRYRLGALLGQGGMGEVWEGIDNNLRRPVAVKVITLSLSADPVLVRRFQREAVIAASLQHPGITVVHDVGQHQGHPFMVMELLHGQDLCAMLGTAPAGIAIGEAVSLITHAAQALSAAHAHGVVHRDLKPANLFMLSGGQLKVCDFGIAHLAEATSVLTATGQFIGTPAYMSPEQWRGEQAGASSDLYSLGCVLYALLTGKPPFPAHQAPHALMHQHLKVIAPGPRTLRLAVPPDLDKLTQELLAKDPADRPADADVVVARLQAIKAGLSARMAGTDPSRAISLLNQAAQIERTSGAGTALQHIATAMASLDITQAEHLARSIDNSYEQASALSEIARVMADTSTDKAEQIASTIARDELKAIALATIAIQVIPTDPGYARRLLDEAEQWARSGAEGSVLAMSLLHLLRVIGTTDRDRSHRLIAEAEHAARTVDDEDCRGLDLAYLGEAAAVTDPATAMRLLNDAERLAHSLTREDGRSNRLLQIAIAMAKTGTDLDRAEQIARAASVPSHQVAALVAIAMAATGRHEHALAMRLLNEADALAQGITGDSGQGLKVRKIAVAMAAVAPDRARQIAETITSEAWRCECLVEIAGVVADDDPVAAAELLDEAATEAHEMNTVFRDDPLAKVAAALARTDAFRAEQVARTVIETTHQVRALTQVALIVADTDPVQAIRLLTDIERLTGMIPDDDQNVYTLITISELIQKIRQP
jgi:serine/threonine protein kinase